MFHKVFLMHRLWMRVQNFVTTVFGMPGGTNQKLENFKSVGQPVDPDTLRIWVLFLVLPAFGGIKSSLDLYIFWCHDDSKVHVWVEISLKLYFGA